MNSINFTRFFPLCWLSCAVALFAGCEQQSPQVEVTATAEATAKATAPVIEQAKAAVAPLEDEHDMHTLALPLRLAFMTGHVKAGLALYRAGEMQMAAPHLLHPVSETHQEERKGIDKLGFNGEVFEQVSAALDANKAAADIEPLLVKAETNLAMVAQKAGGNSIEIIQFLLDTTIEEYTIAINNGVITDLGEYQDAYGFIEVAIDHSANLASPLKDQVLIALRSVAALWPQGPLPVEQPTSVEQVKNAVTKVAGLLN